MNGNEMVSVVVPVKNREHLVKRTLESIRNQTYRPLHLIVVDNNSSDSTKAVVGEWADKNSSEDFQVSVVDEKRPGAAAARNRGLEEVKTDKLLFFDSDDEMVATLISECMEVFAEFPDTEVVCWRVGEMMQSGKIRKYRFSEGDKLRTHIYHGMLSTQAFMIRKDFLDKTGRWDDHLMCWNDWELGMRILLNEPQIRGIDRVMAIVHHQKDSITGDDFHSKQGMWEMSIDKCEEDVERLGHPRARALKSMLNCRRAILAAHYRREGSRDIAEALLTEALSHSTLNPLTRLWLRLLYLYTAAGGRGASRLWL